MIVLLISILCLHDFVLNVTFQEIGMIVIIVVVLTTTPTYYDMFCV